MFVGGGIWCQFFFMDYRGEDRDGFGEGNVLGRDGVDLG